MPAKKKTTKTKTAARKKTTARTRPTPRKIRRREPESLRLRTAAPSLTVNDIAKSLEWYRDVLGFTVRERYEHEDKLMGAEMVAGSVSFYITQDDWKKGRDRVKGEGCRIYCETAQNVDTLAVQIKARGGTLLEEPHDMSWGGRSLAVIDPDGFRITITTS